MPEVDSDWVPQGGGGPSPPKVDWKQRLIRTRSGDPKALLANAITALRDAPEWAGVLAFDEFGLRAVAKRPPVFGGDVGEWSDQEDRLLADWLQHQGIAVSTEIAGQAVQAVAHDQTFHPVREYLEGLRWDGTRRIDGWLNLYLGAEPGDYTVSVGERYLRSAVARIMQPGCKADCCLILEGEQGLRKSTALKILGSPWFSDEIADLGSKDAALQTRGVWLIEIQELESMTRPDIGRVKGFMSRAVDRFRPPYGRHLIESPRQCVFAGSVNHGEYLRDETGGRRFWPVACTRILVDELARDRDQLWAEAVASYRAGAPWWLDTKELVRLAEDEQAQRQEEGVWDALIYTWLDGRLAGGFDSVSVPEVLDLCLKKKASEWNIGDKMRVGGSLKRAGWIRFRLRPQAGFGLEWRYKPPVPTSSGNISRSGNTASD
jgi:predicted P-loop ATPase